MPEEHTEFDKHEIPEGMPADIYEGEPHVVSCSYVTFADYFGEGDVVTVYAGKATKTGRIVEINDHVIVIEEVVANYNSIFFAMDKIDCVRLKQPAGDDDGE